MGRCRVSLRGSTSPSTVAASNMDIAKSQNMKPPLQVLRECLRSGDPQPLQQILQSPPPPSSQSVNPTLNLSMGPGRSAAFEAAEEGHAQVLELLLKAGANPNAQNGYGRTALMEAARMGHAEAVKVLISNGADINVQNKNTWTAAHYAAAGGCTDALHALGEAGADLNIQMKDGSTPALLAAAGGHIETFAIMLEFKVDLSIVRSTDGMSAMLLYMMHIDQQMLQRANCLTNEGDSNSQSP